MLLHLQFYPFRIVSDAAGLSERANTSLREKRIWPIIDFGLLKDDVFVFPVARQISQGSCFIQARRTLDVLEIGGIINQNDQ